MAEQEKKSIFEENFFLIIGIVFLGLGGSLIFIGFQALSEGYYIFDGVVLVGFGICAIFVYIYDKIR